MMGKFLVALMLGCAIVGGGLMYYMQVYAFYETLPETTPLQITHADGTLHPLDLIAFQGIDANSSPLRFRACVTLDDPSVLDLASPAPEATPLIAPGWFDCFDAAAIGGALERGEASAALLQHDITRGVDRVIAAFPDGRAYVWHQLNGTLEK